MRNTYLPPANLVCQGYVFTGVCLSTGGGVVSQHALQVVSQHALQQVSGGRVVSQHALQVSRPTPKGEVEGDLDGGSRGPHAGVPAPGGACSRGVPAPGGACSRGVCGDLPITATAVVVYSRSLIELDLIFLEMRRLE